VEVDYGERETSGAWASERKREREKERKCL